MQASDTNFIYTETTGDKSNPCFIAGEERQDSVIYIPLKSFNPILPLNKPGHIAGSLIYTLVFLIIFAFLRIRSKGLFSLMLSVRILYSGFIPFFFYTRYRNRIFFFSCFLSQTYYLHILFFNTLSYLHALYGPLIGLDIQYP